MDFIPKEAERELKIPQHIAIIMDGNGRWARSRGLDRTEGHIAGVSAVRRLLDAAIRLGVKVVTLYTFSVENWNRPIEEVEALMNLLVRTVHKEVPDLLEKKIRLRVVGDLEGLPLEPREALQAAISQTDCPGENQFDLVLALNYSAQIEITHAFKQVMKSGVKPEEVSPHTISQKLYAPDLPYPDLLIRTGGEKRVSNFLLWQLAYSELYFTDIYWPDFGEDELMEAIADYSGRQRRYGRTGEQIEEQSIVIHDEI